MCRTTLLTPPPITHMTALALMSREARATAAVTPTYVCEAPLSNLQYHTGPLMQTPDKTEEIQVQY